jgi:TolB protein
VALCALPALAFGAVAPKKAAVRKAAPQSVAVPQPAPPQGATAPAAQQQPAAPPGGAPTKIIIGTPGAAHFAIPDCIPRAGDEASREACRTITQVLRADLRFEFPSVQFVPESMLTAIPAMNPDAPNFKDWESIGAGILIVSRAAVSGGEMNVDVKVHAVPSGQSMLAKRYSGKADNPRVFAHQASDDIMTLTQYRGVARTKLAFVSDRDATKERRSKELYIVDYDGFNPRRVTVNGSINILPAWSPDGRSLAYVSYRQGAPDIFQASIYEGKSANLTGGKGTQSFAPTFSADGKHIAFASNRSGNMDVWVANADGSGGRRLTTSNALDTAPCWSPTGQELGFTSDRGGSPQIYVMDADGLNVRRLTNVGNYNDACAWNPSKEYPEVAYTSRLEGGFEIAVLDIATGQVRQITQGHGSCEYPTWAPNGRHLAFSCQRGGSWQINVSNRDGSDVQTLAAGPGNNVYPDWGP